VHGKPAKGRIVGVEETANPDLLRLTVHFDPSVDVSTSDLFDAKRSRITMVFGKDGRSKRLTGTDAGGFVLRAV
jgi:Glyoxalase superfamily protein